MLHPLSIAPIWRRILAGLYDTILLFAIWMLAIAVLLPFLSAVMLQSHHTLLQVYLFLVTGLFFTFFWVKGEQTLGMKAWRLRVCTPEGNSMCWSQAWKRFVLMVISIGFSGMGILWAFFSPKKLMWHDYFSDTRVRFIPKSGRAQGWK